MIIIVENVVQVSLAMFSTALLRPSAMRLPIPRTTVPFLVYSPVYLLINGWMMRVGGIDGGNVDRQL